MLEEIQELLSGKEDEILKEIRLKKFIRYSLSHKFFEEENMFRELIFFLGKGASRFFASSFNPDIEEEFRRVKAKNLGNGVYGKISRKILDVLSNIKKISQDEKGNYYFPWIYLFTKTGVCTLSYEDGGNNFQILMTEKQMAEFKRLLKSRKLGRFVDEIALESQQVKRKINKSKSKLK